MHVLFVCSGNTCRSPLAEARFRQLLAEQGREDIDVSSAGTSAYDGAPASEGAYLVALERGLDLGAHRARLLTPELVTSADLILAMSSGHVARVQRLGGSERVRLLSEYAGEEGVTAEVADPFGLDVEIYRRTLDQLDHLLAAALPRVLAEGRK